MRQYHYQVHCRVPGGTISVYGGTISANSKAKVIAFIRRSYSNIVDYNIW